MRFVRLIVLAVPLLLLSTCTTASRTGLRPGLEIQPAAGPDNPLSTVGPALAADLAEVLNAETPPGIDPDLYASLKDALAAVLRQRISGGEGTRAVSYTPFGVGSRVNDLVLGGDGPYRLSWTYRNRGDYDLNGEANISDLTQVGLHFGKTQADPLWLLAKCADGDGNGEVNVADVTPIGMNYHARVLGYRLYATDDLAGDWTSVDSITIDTLLRNQDRYCFKHVLPSLDYAYYILWTYDDSDYEGGWSNIAAPGAFGEMERVGFFDFLE